MAQQLKIPATYMRGGTSKGVFFNLTDLPPAAQQPGRYRDQLLLRVIGSPDPYGKHTDGMGGATSSTSKCVILNKSSRPDHDVDYLFGQIAIDQALVDWTGNCGNLTAAVGAYAINQQLVERARVPENGVVVVRIWQVNIQKTILVHVTLCAGQVQETGDFMLDGVTFPACEVPIEFLDPAAGDGLLFPTGQVTETLPVPATLVPSGQLPVTLINAGIPTIFVRAQDLGFTGIELQEDINNNAGTLARLEQLRAIGALRMGLISALPEAAQRAHTPKIAFVAEPKPYVTASGQTVAADAIDLLVRALSMGKLHHAMMGTAAVAIAAAAAIPGTLVNTAAGGGAREFVRFGHPSGVLRVGATAIDQGGQWQIARVAMSRSARVLMEGWVRVPEP